MGAERGIVVSGEGFYVDALVERPPSHRKEPIAWRSD